MKARFFTCVFYLSLQVFFMMYIFNINIFLLTVLFSMLHKVINCDFLAENIKRFRFYLRRAWTKRNTDIIIWKNIWIISLEISENLKRLCTSFLDTRLITLPIQSVLLTFVQNNNWCIKCFPIRPWQKYSYNDFWK